MQVIFSYKSLFEMEQRVQEFITKRLYKKYYPYCLNHYKYLECY